MGVKDVLAQPVKDVMALYTRGASHIPEASATVRRLLGLSNPTHLSILTVVLPRKTQ